VNGAFVGVLTQTIKLHNPLPYGPAIGNLYVPLLRNDTMRGYAVLSNVTSPEGQPTMVVDDSGNAIAQWNNVAVNAEQTVTFELEYHTLSLGTHYSVNSSLEGSYDVNSNLYTRFTQPEPLVQSDNPQIIQLARNLTGNSDGLHGKVLAVYNFVVNYLRYQVQDEERGALWALENGVGDCSEFSYLFVALCRAAGIPARIQAGFAFHNAGESLADGHMWAEYYLENYGWIPVDPTWKQFDALDSKHFSSQQRIPELGFYANYVFNSVNGPEVTDEQTVQLKQASASIFGEDSEVGKIVNAVQAINGADYALFLGRLFGESLLFPSEIGKAERTLLESKLQLQNAIDSWDERSQTALLDLTRTLDDARSVSENVLWLITGTIALFIGVLAAAMLAILVYLRRSMSLKRKQYTNTLQ